jgi:hypothetical protein
MVRHQSDGREAQWNRIRGPERKDGWWDLSATVFQAFQANLWFLARVIQEELLKDLASKSEMSDWFNREDAPETAAPLVTRPNPKNKQNAAKIEELDREIKRCALNRIQGLDLTADYIRAPD